MAGASRTGPLLAQACVQLQLYCGSTNSNPQAPVAISTAVFGHMHCQGQQWCKAEALRRAPAGGWPCGWPMHGYATHRPAPPPRGSAVETVVLHNCCTMAYSCWSAALHHCDQGCQRCPLRWGPRERKGAGRRRRRGRSGVRRGTAGWGLITRAGVEDRFQRVGWPCTAAAGPGTERAACRPSGWPPPGPCRWDFRGDQCGTCALSFWAPSRRLILAQHSTPSRHGRPAPGAMHPPFPLQRSRPGAL